MGIGIPLLPLTIPMSHYLVTHNHWLQWYKTNQLDSGSTQSTAVQIYGNPLRHWQWGFEAVDSGLAYYMR